ncbi:MAG: M13 family metallopeptidase [Pseudomonadota bacterium]
MSRFMRHVRIGCALLFVSLVGVPGASTAKEPSSEIPKRREFPVSDKIKPCQDFYQYACSEVISSFKLRPDRSSHSFAFDDARERTLKTRMEFLAALAKQNPQRMSPRVQGMQNVYAACMSPEAKKAEEPSLVRRFGDEIAGIKTIADFRDYAARKMLTPEFRFVEFDIDNNLDDSTKDDLLLMSHPLFFPARSYYEKGRNEKDEFKTRMAAFQDIVRSFFQTIGADNPDQRAAAVVRFEILLAPNVPSRADLRDLIMTRDVVMTKEQALAAYPNLQLDALLSRVPDQARLRVIYKRTFDFLNNQVLTDVPAVDLETLKDYYLFHSAYPYMDEAYPDFFNQVFAFRNKFLGGPEVRPVLAERCTRTVMGRFEHEIDFELLPRVYPHFDKAKLQALIERVRGTIRDSLTGNSWLSSDAKQEALLKLNTATLQLFSPDRIEDWDFNPPAAFSPDRHYANIMTLDKNRSDRILQELPVHNKTRWPWGPLTVNASASPNDNRLNYPAGILVPPVYDSGPKAPDFVNLGAIGAVIGHELGHLFDDQGAKFDHTGKLRDWMPPADLKKFKERGKPMIDQFDAAYPKYKEYGKQTQGENIGDFVGITFAYRTAFPKDEGSPEAKKALFLQWGRSWCMVAREQYLDTQMRTNEHPIGEARVNQQVIQQPGFYEAYACREGDAMYLPPEKRLEIW